MDEAKILELAEQSGLAYLEEGGAAFNSLRDDVDITPYLLAFARLVAAAEREACADIAVHHEANGIRGVYSAIRSRTE